MDSQTAVRRCRTRHAGSCASSADQQSNRQRQPNVLLSRSIVVVVVVAFYDTVTIHAIYLKLLHYKRFRKSRLS